MHLTALKHASFLISKALDDYHAKSQITDRQTHLQDVQKNCAFPLIYLYFLLILHTNRTVSCALTWG